MMGPLVGLRGVFFRPLEAPPCLVPDRRGVVAMLRCPRRCAEAERPLTGVVVVEAWLLRGLLGVVVVLPPGGGTAVVMVVYWWWLSRVGLDTVR